MRILKTVQAYYPFQEMGGPVVKVRAIAGALAARGHRVTVLTADLGLARNNHPSVAVEPCTSGSRAEMDATEVVYLKTLAHYRSLTLNPGLPGFCRKAPARYDIMHVYGLYDLLGPTAAHFFARAGVPYVIEPMGMYRPIARNLALKRLYHRLFDFNFIRGARFLIATSPQEQSEIIHGGVPAGRVVVRRNGIQVPANLPRLGAFRDRWRIAPAASIILFLGRLVSKKSPDLLITAFARWRAKSPVGAKAVLVLAGPCESDGYRARLKRQADQFQLGDSVLFAGPLFDDEKWAAFRDADLFVLPSLHENFGNAAGEAMACGTPVIVTESCGIAPFVAGRAGLVIPHEVDSLCSAIQQLIENPAGIERCRAACSAVVAGLTWEQPIAELEELYNSVMRERVSQ
jgi:glycosyltransferase involved in cell wall biosynthesis